MARLCRLRAGHRHVGEDWIEDPDDRDAYRDAITDQTKAVFVEALGNPCANIVDIEAVARIAHERGIPLVMDAMFATPYLLQAFDFGVDILCHPATKYLAGHGTTVSGGQAAGASTVADPLLGV